MSIGEAEGAFAELQAETAIVASQFGAGVNAVIAASPLDDRDGRSSPAGAAPAATNHSSTQPSYTSERSQA